MRVHDNVIKWLENIFIVLGTLALIVAAWYILPADAADMETPKKPKAATTTPAPAPVIGTSPFSIGVFGGVGMSPTENDLTIAGQSLGGIKGWPTGILAGVTAEYLNTSTSTLAWGFDARLGYDFDAGCAGLSCSAERKNGFLLQAGLEAGISLTTLGGLIPTSGQPSNWPVPINVPTSVYQNWLLMAEGGFAGRNIDLCAAVDMVGDFACGNKFIAAPYAAVKNKFMISTNSEIEIRWDHIFWGNQYQFTPTAAIPLFANSVNITHEDLFTAGWKYHF